MPPTQMQTAPDNSEHLPLGDALEELLKSDEARGPSIGEIVDTVGEKGFGLTLMVLSLPSALPVPAPGYSTPFGIVIGLIALQMMLGRQTLWVPERLKASVSSPRCRRPCLAQPPSS